MDSRINDTVSALPVPAGQRRTARSNPAEWLAQGIAVPHVEIGDVKQRDRPSGAA